MDLRSPPLASATAQNNKPLNLKPADKLAIQRKITSVITPSIQTTYLPHSRVPWVVYVPAAADLKVYLQCLSSATVFQRRVRKGHAPPARSHETKAHRSSPIFEFRGSALGVIRREHGAAPCGKALARLTESPEFPNQRRVEPSQSGFVVKDLQCFLRAKSCAVRPVFD